VRQPFSGQVKPEVQIMVGKLIQAPGEDSAMVEDADLGGCRDRPAALGGVLESFHRETPLGPHPALDLGALLA